MTNKSTIFLIFCFIFISCNGKDYYRNELHQYANLEAGGNALEIEITTFEPVTEKSDIEKKIKETKVYLFTADGLLSQAVCTYSAGDLEMTSSNYYNYDENRLCVKIQSKSDIANLPESEDLSYSLLLSRKNNKEIWVKGEWDLSIGDFKKNTLVDTTYHEFGANTSYDKIIAKGEILIETMIHYDEKGNIIKKVFLTPLQAEGDFVYDDRNLLVSVNITDSNKKENLSASNLIRIEYIEFDKKDNWTKCILKNESKTYTLIERKITYQ